MPTFSCDLTLSPRPLHHHWEHSVGSGHASLGLRADWQAQLVRCRRELGFRHVRFHGVLDDDMQVVVEHDHRLVHRFQTIDRVYDAVLDADLRPFVELSFMPGPLASGDDTVFRYAANVTPPRNYDEWTALITDLLVHWVERYGEAEVGRWPVEVWNEANQPRFWSGDRDAYFELYARTVETVKAVVPAMRVGGPVTSKGQWIDEFLDAAERRGAPVDFVSTHFYPSDAATEGSTHERLRAAERGWMRSCAERAAARARGRPLYYTEWNSSSDDRDPLHDEPYAAAYIARTVMSTVGLVAGTSFWTFTDLFLEHGTPAAPYHGGFGLLNQYGVPKPSYRAFELLRGLGDELLPSTGEHPTVDAWFSRRGDQVIVLLSNHALPGRTIERERVELRLRGAGPPRGAIRRQIDEQHGNPKPVWEQLGKPSYPDERTLAVLESASAIASSAQPFAHEGGVTTLSVELPAHAVASVQLDYLDSLDSLDSGGGS